MKDVSDYEIFSTWMRFLEIQIQESSPIFDKIIEWNTRDEDWNNAKFSPPSSPSLDVKVSINSNKYV